MAKTRTRPSLHGVEVGALDETEIGEAAGVLARAIRDNPIFVAALRRDPRHRQEVLARLFADTATVFDWTRHTLVARSADGSIVGVCRLAPPGERRLRLRQLVRLLPAVVRLGPRSVARLLRWRRARVPPTRHWRLGPLATDAHLQGMGVGSRLMCVACAQLDAAGGTADLETDTASTVDFYERFGFAVVSEAQVLGVPTWFMRRPAAR